MDKFYQKIVEPILSIDAETQFRLADELESVVFDNDDNLLYNARMRTVEVLRRFARVQQFADKLLSDNWEEELEIED